MSIFILNRVGVTFKSSYASISRANDVIHSHTCNFIAGLVEIMDEIQLQKIALMTIDVKIDAI